MPWVGAVIGGVAALAGSMEQSNAVGDAAQQQADATNAGIAENRRQYDLTRSDFAPYREAGVKALGQLQTDINTAPTAAEVMSDPGYQFGLQQGQRALERRAAAMGGRVSGAALKAASEYATNYASTGYNAAYQRRQDRLNRLASLAGIGQTATGSSAQAGAAATGAITSLIGNQGDASAAAQLARGNIWANTTNQLGAIGQRWATQSGNTYGAGSGYQGANGTWYANNDLSGTNRGSGD